MVQNNEYVVGKDLELQQFNRLKKEKTKIKDLLTLAKSVNIGYYLVVPILCGIVIGSFADRYLNTKPTMTIIGVLFGTISTFYNLFKLVKENQQ